MSRKQSFVLPVGRMRARIVASMCQFVERLSPDVEFRVTIGRNTKPRTNEANAYLWGVCYAALAEVTGHSANEWHEYFCGEVFGWKDVSLPGGRHESKPRRTTTTDEDGKADTLSTGDFWDFVERVRQHAADADIFIPDPDPLHGAGDRWGESARAA